MRSQAKQTSIAGWQSVQLGEIFDIGSSKRVLQKQWKRSGVPFYRAREVVQLAKSGLVDNDLFISEQHFAELQASHCVPRSGDLMVSAVGTLGACYVVQPHDRFYFKDASVLQFRPTQEVEPRFFQYLFLSDAFLREVRKSDGATVGTLTITRAKALSLSLPPLEEQKRIVAALDQAFAALDRARALAEANLADAEELFGNGCNAVFKDLSFKYATRKLADLSVKITKGSSPKWQGFSYVDEPGVLFVTSENVLTNMMRFEKTKYVEEGFNRKDAKSILQYGDVLTNIVGASIGRTAVFERDDNANINQAVCLIRCNTQALRNYFLAYLLNSPYFKRKLHEAEVNMARANLSLTFFRDFEVPLPPLSVQDQIIANMRALRRKIDAASSLFSKQLSDLADLRQSLLQKAFAGELS